MVTAADGAENFYDSATNEARYESPAEATEKDIRIREAYMGHPKWYMIDNNCESFDDKMVKTKKAVHDALSAPIGEDFNAKYLIKHDKNLSESNGKVPLNTEKFPHHEIINIE